MNLQLLREIEQQTPRDVQIYYPALLELFNPLLAN